MRAVMLCAGKSTRTWPLTVNKPKPLLKILGTTIIEHNLDQLRGIVDEVVIIVGFMKERIMDLIGEKYQGIKITYVKQKNQHGTADAVCCAADYVSDRFIVLNGDDLYSKKDILNCIKHKHSVLGKQVSDPEKWGMIEAPKSKLKRIIEKPKKSKLRLANTALYVLDKSIFKIKKKRSKRGEFEFTDMVTEFAKNHDVKVIEVKDYWLPVGYPWHLLDASHFFISRITKNKIQGKIEHFVTIKGKVHIGKGSLIKSGSYIEGNAVVGDNTTIGPNCYIRGSTYIGNNCKIGLGAEIKNSVIMNDASIPHWNYVGDSIIGERSNLGAGTKIANLKHDRSNVKSKIQGKLIDTGRMKFGTIIGDNVHTGINTSILPGRKLWPNTTTLPGEVVNQDKQKN